MPKIHVICHLPQGQYRGGRFNQGCKSYEPGDHTPAQLRELVADPYHTVVVGEVLTEKAIAATEETQAKAKKPAV